MRGRYMRVIYPPLRSRYLECYPSRCLAHAYTPRTPGRRQSTALELPPPRVLARSRSNSAPTHRGSCRWRRLRVARTRPRSRRPPPGAYRQPSRTGPICFRCPTPGARSCCRPPRSRARSRTGSRPHSAEQQVARSKVWGCDFARSLRLLSPSRGFASEGQVVRGQARSPIEAGGSSV